MRKILCTLLILTWTAAAWPGEDQDARAIIDKAIQAAGGEAKLARLKAMTWKEKGTYYGMGDGLPYAGVYAIQWPNQFRMEIEGVFTIVLDGDKGWMQSGGETKELTKDELALQHHNHKAGWIFSLLPLKDKAFQLKALGETKVGKEATRVVQVTRKDYPDAKLYFAKDTGLLIQSEFRTKAPEQQFKEVTQTFSFSDFRDLDGAKVAHKLVLKRDGKVFVEAEISDMKAAGKLDAKVFVRPGKD